MINEIIHEKHGYRYTLIHLYRGQTIRVNSKGMKVKSKLFPKPSYNGVPGMVLQKCEKINK